MNRNWIRTKQKLFRIAGIGAGARLHGLHTYFDAAIHSETQAKRLEMEKEAFRLYLELLEEGRVPRSKSIHRYVVRSCEQIAKTGTKRGNQIELVLDGVKARDPVSLREAVAILFDVACLGYKSAAEARDEQRQAGTRKSPEPRHSKLDRWIDKELAQNPDLSARELWRMLEESDPEVDDLSVDPEEGRLYEHDRKGTKKLAFRGFRKRVTEAKKRVAHQ